MRLFRFLPALPASSSPTEEDGAHLILAGLPPAPTRLAPRLQCVTAVGGSVALLADGRRLVLHPGCYAIFAATTAVTVLPGEHSQARVFAVAAPRSDVRSFFEDTREPDTFVSPLLERFRRALEIGELGRRRAEEMLESLFVAATRRDEATRAQLRHLGEREATRDDLFRRIQRARESMDAHCGELPSAAHAAQIACMSLAHFHRCFAQIIGVTPHRYLTQRRMDEARMRLRRSHVPIAQLSQSLGFQCPWTLTALFRRTYGVTPAQYRAGLEPAQPIAA